jgi:acyl-coenzyme A synthetase/AMP-(fatty) acid ligase
MGASVLCVEANATADVCLDIVAKYKVSNLATTPTVLRSLMAKAMPCGWSARRSARSRAVASR